MSLLEVRGLQVAYPTVHGTLRAVDGVDVEIEAGATVGLVGESGSGKSSLARAIVGLAPVTGGTVSFRGEDVTRLAGPAAKRLRRSVQLIFQDPYASLNPRMTVGEAIEEPMLTHFDHARKERRREVARLLELVGLGEPDARLYPFQFSGGQRQRIAIARALAAQPDLIIADEITSALDVSVQSAILNLLRELQSATGVACLLITHNLAVVRYLAQQVAVMHLGKIVEAGPAADVLHAPCHPYTKVLIESAPRLHRRERLPVRIAGDLPDPHGPPAGCRFHTRCPVGPLADPARAICRTDDPHLDAERRPRHAACHFATPPQTASSTLGAARSG